MRESGQHVTVIPDCIKDGDILDNSSWNKKQRKIQLDILRTYPLQIKQINNIQTVSKRMEASHISTGLAGEKAPTGRSW